MLGKHSTKLFKDITLDNKMVEDGYIILPFLEKNDIKFFKDLYCKWHKEDPKDFYKSYFNQNLEYKAEVESEILRCFKLKMKDVFHNYDAFGGLFVVKPNGEKGHFPVHQDWSFVDETRSWSINMWCPLEDVNDDNGNLMVLKGSHRFLETVRGSGTPDIYREHTETIKSYIKSLPMKAGQAVFFFHGLLHGSTPNINTKPRVSLGLTLTPKNEQLYFHYFNDDKQLIKYKVDADFYINYTSNRHAEPKSTGELSEFSFDHISESDLVTLITKEGGQFNDHKPLSNLNKSFFSFKKWFKTS